MAIFRVVEGAPGQGKSLYTARFTLDLLKRNLKWYKKSGIKREVWSNLKFCPALEKKYDGFIKYWTDTSVLCKLRDVDVIWDEIATELDSRNYLNLSEELKRFLSQYRKRGIEIYANTQDFSMVDARARLMISSVYTLKKIIGSRDPSNTKPPVKYIWGLIMVRDVLNFRETDPEKKQYNILPNFFFITRDLIEIYDTTQDIEQGELPPLRHIERHCELPNCKKGIHIIHK
jgi:hypothetical protein